MDRVGKAGIAALLAVCVGVATTAGARSGKTASRDQRRGRIDGASNPDLVAGDRRNIDDVPSLLLFHPRQHRGNAVQNSLNVDIDHAIPVVNFEAGEISCVRIDALFLLGYLCVSAARRDSFKPDRSTLGAITSKRL